MVCLLGLDLTAAAAPQKKVAMKKVSAEPRRAAAPSGDPVSGPQGRKGIQRAQMTAAKLASIYYIASQLIVFTHIICTQNTNKLVG